MREVKFVVWFLVFFYDWRCSLGTFGRGLVEGEGVGLRGRVDVGAPDRLPVLLCGAPLRDRHGHKSAYLGQLCECYPVLCWGLVLHLFLFFFLSLCLCVCISQIKIFLSLCVLFFRSFSLLG